MERARQIIAEALSTAQAPVVLSSFGKDSLLLLQLVREINNAVPVLWFKEGCSPEQQQFAREIIKAWRLDVYSYHPADVYLLAEGANSALIQEYSFGLERLPVVVDLAKGTACVLEAFTERTPLLFLPFDTLLIGYKQSDAHWVLPEDTEVFGTDYRLGRSRVVTPLRHLSDDQVRAAVVELNIPYQAHNDELSFCTACLTGATEAVWCPKQQREIPREHWAPEQSLQSFRTRFSLNS